MSVSVTTLTTTGISNQPTINRDLALTRLAASKPLWALIRAADAKLTCESAGPVTQTDILEEGVRLAQRANGKPIQVVTVHGATFYFIGTVGSVASKLHYASSP